MWGIPPPENRPPSTRDRPKDIGGRAGYAAKNAPSGHAGRYEGRQLQSQRNARQRREHLRHRRRNKCFVPQTSTDNHRCATFCSITFPSGPLYSICEICGICEKKHQEESVKSVESVRIKRGICEKKRKDDDTPQCPSVARRGWSDRHKRQRCGAAQGSRTAPRTLFLDEDNLLDARDAARGTGLGVPIEPEIVHFVAVGGLQVARERAVVQVQIVVGDGHHIV